MIFIDENLSFKSIGTVTPMTVTEILAKVDLSPEIEMDVPP